ncbi:hypothetical protein ACIRU3_05750 [Streptomyces sp. NPDC101151]|uniref:hypothetical protein n=1 Tax=Streptomyces sp. NPDC101151 TaxID=3366115 RepID=UPI003801B645
MTAGVPGEDLGTRSNAGSAVVPRGSGSGPTGAGAQVISQDTPDVLGAAEKGDLFGAAVHMGDADGDGRADPAAGAPGENGSSGFVRSFRSGPATVVSPSGTTAFGASVLGTPAANGRIGSVFTY